jgi:hypothetical protein
VTPRLQAIALDATVVATHGAAAERRMNDYLAGWPSGAPSSGSSTPSEGSGIPHDKHRKTLEEWGTLTKRVSTDLRRLATLALLYGAEPANASSISQRINEIDSDIWCPDCRRFGSMQPKEPKRSVCRWHRDWNEKHPGIPAPESMVKAKAEGADRAMMGRLYSVWLAQNPQAAKPKQQRKASTAANRGTEVETSQQLADRFNGAA